MTNISSTAVDKKEFASIATKEYSQVTSQVPEVHENVVKDNVQEKHKEDEEEKKNVDVRNKFGYEDFFSNEIEKKKLDHTYRVFLKLMNSFIFLLTISLLSRCIHKSIEIHSH